MGTLFASQTYCSKQGILGPMPRMLACWGSIPKPLQTQVNLRAEQKMSPDIRRRSGFCPSIDTFLSGSSCDRMLCCCRRKSFQLSQRFSFDGIVFSQVAFPAGHPNRQMLSGKTTLTCCPQQQVHTAGRVFKGAWGCVPQQAANRY